MLSEPARRQVTVIAHDSTDARVLRRLRGLQAAGVDVLCLSFRRSRGGRAHTLPVRNLDLGVTHDARYGHRLWAMARGMVTIWHARRLIATTQRFYAVNADSAILALAARRLSGSRAPLAVEIADVQRPMLGRSARAVVLRALERVVLRRSDLLVTSSPGFVRHYFGPVQGRDSDVFLLENKVHPDPGFPSPADDPAGTGPWVVGWYGAFACERSWRIVRDLAVQLDGVAEFHLHGFPTFTDGDTFRREIEAARGVSYIGAYTSPEDLPSVYGQSDFAWAIDFRDPEHNSRWCLPNRLYESAAAGVPVLAVRSTETGAWVEAHGSGRTFGERLEAELLEFLRTVTIDDWRAMRRAVAAVPRESVYGAGDYEALLARLVP
ncbi:glycosyltransferase [Cellulomonas sp. NS3]|uniref:glycosyltransferase n=1 Tax=Cellulomonas sp. NS3 TaxID=2973977 RepID=UPI0021631358|nr:glycosyltransferase [Cellulomonas sp. NS3]